MFKYYIIDINISAGRTLHWDKMRYNGYIYDRRTYYYVENAYYYIIKVYSYLFVWYGQFKVLWIENALIFQAILLSIVTLVPILITIAFFTLLERKLMASIHRRKGPDVVGFYGILQPIIDGIKLIFKEIIKPSRSNFFLFVCSPLITLILSFLSWVIIPLGYHNVISDINLGILYILSISALSVYGIIIAGWASNSKYAFLGALRSAAQMISYEVSISFIMLPLILLSGSVNLTDIVFKQQQTIWFIFPLFPFFIIFFISALAETNRAPFDLPEAEAELVAGFNVEYSSIIFAMFFLGEYGNMILMSTLIVIFFLGGWGSFFNKNMINFLTLKLFEVQKPLYLIPYCRFKTNYLFIFVNFLFFFKILLCCLFFIFIRANFPRYRYDQLMDLCWKIFLPLSISYFIFLTSILFVFDAMPYIFELLLEDKAYKSALTPFLRCWRCYSGICLL